MCLILIRSCMRAATSFSWGNSRHWSRHFSSSQKGIYRVHLSHLAQFLSHVWLCDPMDCSPPASSVHGIFQARILKWVAISFSNSPLPIPWRRETKERWMTPRGLPCGKQGMGQTSGMSSREKQEQSKVNKLPHSSSCPCCHPEGDAEEEHHI